MKFTRTDRIWLATASLLYPSTNPVRLVSKKEILREIEDHFPINITHVMLTHHLVSWVARQAKNRKLKSGGNRNRYLFRYLDGQTPSRKGLFRLYKQQDSQYDGWDKTGKTLPKGENIPIEYQYLLKWYHKNYYGK